VPRGKDFCLYENQYFDVGEFKVIDGVRVHDIDPRHRPDGVLVKSCDDKVDEPDIKIPPPARLMR
jgi:hypothetical protein